MSTKIKIQKDLVNNNDINKLVAQHPTNLKKIIDKYYEGMESIAEFCGKIDALVATGLTPSEAKETVVLLNAIEAENKNKDQQIF